MNYRKYMRRLQNALGENKAADRIKEEPWWNIVMKELNCISKDLSTELQKETGQPYYKPNYDLSYEEAPPTRLLALNIAISSWVGITMEKVCQLKNKHLKILYLLPAKLKSHQQSPNPTD